MPNQLIFTDMIVAAAVLLDAQSDGKTRARFKATQVNVVNDNDRMYPNSVMTDAVEESQTLVKENRMVGESPHPKHYTGLKGQVVFDTKLENSVIKVYNHFMEDGIVYVDAEVLETVRGKDLKVLIDAGIPVGISMRATGDSVRKQIGKAMIDVATKLVIKAYDVVMNPATAGCEVVSVLTDAQVQQILLDGVSTTIPSCPKCNGTLSTQDPDNDGDVDFLYCSPCKEVYIINESNSTYSEASQRLNSVDTYDFDRYDLARKFKAKMNGSITDDQASITKEDDLAMKPEEILKLMQDSPEIQEMINNAAKVIAQPALDALQKQNDDAAAKVITDAAKVSTKAFVDNQIATMKAASVSQPLLDQIVVATKDAETESGAKAIIDAMVTVYSQIAANAALANKGIVDGVINNPDGSVRVEVTHEPKPWSTAVRTYLDSMDRMGEEFGHSFDPSIRKYNQKVIDRVSERFEMSVGFEAMKDSAAFMDSEIAMKDSVSVTTTQLLNQAVIQQALLIQSFQDVESLQFISTETFEGNEMRWPVETYTSAATADPTTGLYDLLVGEGMGIPESSINLSWLTFNPDWRRNAISLSTDVMKTMLSGPAKYDAMTRGIYHIAFDKRRRLDNRAYLEMIMANDEYLPAVVASELPSAPGKVVAVSNATNVVFLYKATLGGLAAATEGTNPIVRPRSKKQQSALGVVNTVTSNPVVTKVGATTLTLGYLDATGSIQGGDYAIDFENGIWYFKASAGLAPAAATPIYPTLFTYSGVTNYDRWSYTVPTGIAPEVYYNTLLQLITKETQLMGSAPRFNKPNMGIMSLNASVYIENASLWYKLNNPDLGGLTGGGTSNNFGNRSGVNFSRINAPWVAGDNRILLGQKGATRYGIETPYQIEGPYPKYDASQQIVDAKLYYGRENSVLCTPQTTDSSGSVINPKYRSIKIVV